MSQYPRVFLAIGLALALPCVSGCASVVRAQSDLDQTPWATSMVYPVGDPLDFKRPAPGETRGFQVSRGLQRAKRGHRRHEGLDLSNRSAGSEVRAVAPGLVVATRTSNAGWGNMVVLAHRLPGGEILFSLAAHLLPGSIAVREGQVVSLGEPLGKIGSTGHATGPHLHLEFRSLKGALDRLTQPLARVWESSAVVDPLHILRSMTPGSGTEPAAKASGATPAIERLVSRGALSPRALTIPNAALTRGELYRIALASLDPAGPPVPRRWSAVRSLLLAKANTLPEPARARFRQDALPRREKDTRIRATHDETVEVLLASIQSGARKAESEENEAARERLAKGFPAGLKSWQERVAAASRTNPSSAGSAASAANASSPETIPPRKTPPRRTTVSRAQVSLLWHAMETTPANPPTQEDASPSASASQ